MDTLYTFKLPKAVDGMTHVGIQEEQRTAVRLYVGGLYGKVRPNGSFRAATMMHQFMLNIVDDQLEDLDQQSLAAGRPSSKPRHALDSADVAHWLEEAPARIKARIDARLAEEEG